MDCCCDLAKFKPRRVCLKPVPFTSAQRSTSPRQAGREVLRKMAAQAWPVWTPVPPGLWPSSSVLFCRCALRRVPDCAPEQPPLLKLRSGWTLQTCFRNGWVVSAGKTCWPAFSFSAARCLACPAHSCSFLPCARHCVLPPPWHRPSPDLAAAQVMRSCGPSQPWRCRKDGTSLPSSSSCCPGHCWSPCGTRAPSHLCSQRTRVSPTPGRVSKKSEHSQC